MVQRLLVINPNTTAAVTERVVALGRGQNAPDVDWVGETGAFGARYISDRASFTIAGHAALDAFARHAGQVDAVLLACFGDPGLLALKEVAGVPVLGLAEASFAEASAGGRRFAIVTGGVRWRPMLTELADALGFGHALAGIETLTLTGGEIAANPDGAIAALGEACQAAAQNSDADVVILGGAGLAGLAARVAPMSPVPVICSVEAGLRAALSSLGRDVRSHAAHAPSILGDMPPVASTGLSPALARLLAGGPP